MAGFLEKMSNFFFKEEDDYLPETTKIQPEDDGYLRMPGSLGSERSLWQDQPEEPVKSKKAKKNNLVTVPTADHGKEQGTMEMVLIKATSYDDMQEIARHIKERKVAVVNFEEMDREVAQRMVDFLSGATFALEGVPRKVSGGTFIFSSADVDMSGQIMDKENSNVDNPFMNEGGYVPNSWLRK